MPKTHPERLLVWRGERKRTSGGLTKDQLVKNSKGRIVSKRASELAKKSSNLKNHLRKKGQAFDLKPKPKKKAPKKVKPKKAPKKGQKLEPVAPRRDGSQKAFDPKALNRTKISVENIILSGKRRRTKRKL
jgi:hypothetical protein